MKLKPIEWTCTDERWNGVIGNTIVAEIIRETQNPAKPDEPRYYRMRIISERNMSHHLSLGEAKMVAGEALISKISSWLV